MNDIERPDMRTVGLIIRLPLIECERFLDLARNWSGGKIVHATIRKGRLHIEDGEMNGHQ